MPRGKFMTLHEYIGKKKSHLDKLNLYLNSLEKEEQNKSKDGGKEIIKVRGEINRIGNKKQ